jgi:hypothetical protein
VGGLKSSYRQAVLIWIAMVFSIFAYLLVVECIKSDVPFLKKDSSSPEVFPIKVFLLSFASFSVFLIWFVRSQVLCGRASKAFKNSPSRLLFCSLATNLLCETVAITGLTLFFLAGSPLSFYPFMVLSLALFAFFFPQYAQWKEWVEKNELVERPLVWLHPSLFQIPELYQGGAPTPGFSAGEPEGSHFRQAAQDGMHRSP